MKINKITAMQTYLFTSTDANADQARQQEAAFIENGHNRSNILKAKSILDVVLQMKRGSVIMVHSVKFCKTYQELIALLHLLHERNITLHSISEPWLNIAITEYLHSVAKIRTLTMSTFNDDEI